MHVERASFHAWHLRLKGQNANRPLTRLLTLKYLIRYAKLKLIPYANSSIGKRKRSLVVNVSTQTGDCRRVCEVFHFFCIS